MTSKEKLTLLEKAIRACENRHPMTGKPDTEAAYKNGWYDCAYHLRCLMEALK